MNNKNEIITNEYFDLQVDAIVNTANPMPVIGSVIDRAIYKAAFLFCMATL